MVRPRRATLAALALVAGGACGGGGGGLGPPTTLRAGPGGGVGATVPEGTVDSIEAKLVEEQRKRFPSLTVGEGSCLEGVPEASPGAAVTCTVAVESVVVPFTVTYLGSQAETEGGGDSYEFRAAKPILEVRTVVDDIRRQASEQLKVAPERVTVDCGPEKVHVLDVGGRILCTVNDGRTTRRLAAVVTDASGAITINEV